MIDHSLNILVSVGYYSKWPRMHSSRWLSSASVLGSVIKVVRWVRPKSRRNGPARHGCDSRQGRQGNSFLGELKLLVIVSVRTPCIVVFIMSWCWGLVDNSLSFGPCIACMTRPVLSPRNVVILESDFRFTKEWYPSQIASRTSCLLGQQPIYSQSVPHSTWSRRK